MGMGTDDKIGNGNGKEWETTCMGMGMALLASRQRVSHGIYYITINKQNTQSYPQQRQRNNSMVHRTKLASFSHVLADQHSSLQASKRSELQ